MVLEVSVTLKPVTAGLIVAVSVEPVRFSPVIEMFFVTSTPLSVVVMDVLSAEIEGISEASKVAP